MKPTREQVLAWAREAGMQVTPGNSFADDMYLAVLYRAFSLAYAAGAAAMQERCASLIENTARYSSTPKAIHIVSIETRQEQAAAIRALGDDDD